MTAPVVAVCPGCDGDQVVVVEVRGTDVQIPCGSCCCERCGRTTNTPPVCLTCDADDDGIYRRQIDV